jgi:hypothetical protein
MSPEKPLGVLYGGMLDIRAKTHSHVPALEGTPLLQPAMNPALTLTPWLVDQLPPGLPSKRPLSTLDAMYAEATMTAIIAIARSRGRWSLPDGALVGHLGAGGAPGTPSASPEKAGASASGLDGDGRPKPRVNALRITTTATPTTINKPTTSPTWYDVE